MTNSTAPNSGFPYRAAAMVFIAVGMACAAIGFSELTGQSSNDQALLVGTTTSSIVKGTTSGISTAPSSSTTSSVISSTSTTLSSLPSSPAPVPPTAPHVRVYNNGTVRGLAAQTAKTLESSGWVVSETGNYNGGNIPATSVYYGSTPGEREAAEKIAHQLGVTAAPRFPGIAHSSPGIIVIVVS